MQAVSMKHITKTYGNVTALNDVSFSLEKGEIHSLLGENGAGKSTLMNVLYGICKPDTGEIKVNDKQVQMKNPRQAIEAGIGMVHQHFMLTPVLSVAENIVIGNEPVKGILFDYNRAVRQVEEMIANYGFNISATEKVENLSVGEQQRVEILKALYQGADILILDEPTAVLTPHEVAELFNIMRELKKAGKSIIIITHKLKETMEIADRITVLRDGTLIKSDMPITDTNPDELANLMVGREVEVGFTRRSECIGETALEVKGLTLEKKGKKVLNNIDFQLHKGEILGVAGIEGNGQTELIEVLTGLTQADAGQILKDGQEMRGNAKQFIERRVGHVPEDRGTRGLIGSMSIEENIILGYHKQEAFVSKKGVFKRREITAFAEEQRENYRIKAPDVNVRCNALSGGNQQKVVIARVFSEDPDIIIVAQPTRGVDIGAMEYIHSKLFDLRDEGKAILLISADLDEVRNLSDSLMVIYDGSIVSRTLPDELSETELGLLMTGSKREEGAHA